jgi:hypothetical protein
MDPSEMTVRELKALVVGRGLEVPKKAKKADLIALLADEPVEEVAVAAPAEPAPTALWAVVDDACLDWVRTMSETHSMPEEDIVRGMIYCSFNTMRSNGMVKSKAAVTGALADKGHVKRWIR